jgi:hypothetical protein
MGEARLTSDPIVWWVRKWDCDAMLILSNLAQRFKLPPVQLGKLGGLEGFIVAPGSRDFLYATFCMRPTVCDYF